MILPASNAQEVSGQRQSNSSWALHVVIVYVWLSTKAKSQGGRGEEKTPDLSIIY